MNKQRIQKTLILRRYLVFGALATAALSVITAAGFLQWPERTTAQPWHKKNHYISAYEIPAYRGMITDRNDEPLAVSSPVDTICADPKQLIQHREQWPLLAHVLGMDAEQLQRKLNRLATEGRRWTQLVKQIQPVEAEQILSTIKSWGWKGAVWSQREYRRYYPDAEITAHLIGHTDIKDQGQEGLELSFNQWLSGRPGRKTMMIDRKGQVIKRLATVSEAVPGRNLSLSIDRRIQYMAYRSLQNAVQQHRALTGSLVIIDVQSGEILAMVNQPAGNPNDRQQRQSELLRNRAVADVFEPGSTMKPFSVALALELGLYTPDSRFDTRPGYRKLDRYLIKDHHNYGILSLTQVVAKSSNVGISMMAEQLGDDELWRFFHGLGFGQAKDIGLISESRGTLRHPSDWDGTTRITQAYGYGLGVTTLQLAHAYSVLASGGEWRPLTLLRREESPPAAKRLVSSGTSRQVIEMLEAAVADQGTGHKAAVPGYRVAGKTGTARKYAEGGYQNDHYVSLFAGVVPATRPRLVMVVVIDDPQAGETYGGVVAAPVFSEVMTAVLPMLNIAPDAAADAQRVHLAYAQDVQ